MNEREIINTNRTVTVIDYDGSTKMIDVPCAFLIYYFKIGDDSKFKNYTRMKQNGKIKDLMIFDHIDEALEDVLNYFNGKTFDFLLAWISMYRHSLIRQAEITAKQLSALKSNSDIFPFIQQWSAYEINK